MKTEKQLQEQLTLVQIDTLETIQNHISRIQLLVVWDCGEKHNGSIRLTDSIRYQYIDEQTDEVICNITLSDNVDAELYATIDRCDSFDSYLVYDIRLDELSINQLIDIVGQLELFETFEDIEMQLM